MTLPVRVECSVLEKKMSEYHQLFGTAYRYLVSYTAHAGRHNELEIQGHNCRIISDRELAGHEIVEHIAQHIQEQDGIPVSQVVIDQIGCLP